MGALVLLAALGVVPRTADRDVLPVDKRRELSK